SLLGLINGYCTKLVFIRNSMQQNNPLVSIIIPTRNRKVLLKDALDSVIAQTYTRLQIIIQDNNSQDGTYEDVKQYLSDKRVEYYRSDKDLSMTENWNAAFSHVRGDYFLRLDDDNGISNDFIAWAIEAITSNSYDVVIYSSLIVNLHQKI